MLPFLKVVIVAFCFANNAALDQRFQGLGPEISHHNPEVVCFAIGKVSSRSRIKGRWPLKIPDDESGGTSCPPDYTRSRKNINPYQEKDAQSDLYGFRHV